MSPCSRATRVKEAGLYENTRATARNHPGAASSPATGFFEKYVDEFKPFDKAGSYGVQDGVTVEKVKGSYDNVMGLPTEKLKKYV